MCVQSVKARAPYTDQTVVDPFLYDTTTTVTPPPKLLISSNLEYLSVFKGFEPFLLLRVRLLDLVNTSENCYPF
jgi:hypothetical protein